MKRSDALGKYFHFDNDFWARPLKCGFLDIYQIGELCCEPGFKVEEHEQSVYEVTYVISGCGYSYVNGDKIKITEGDVMVNSVNHRHAIEADKSSILRYTYMGFRFNGEARTDDISRIKDFYDSAPYHLAKDKNDILYPFMHCIDELYSNRANSFHMIRSYCEQIVILATRVSGAGYQKLPDRSIYPGAVNSAVYSVIRYVEDNIFDIKGIQEIADTLGYNYTYLSHFFKDKTGITLQKYISYKKIERALQLLKYGGISVTQISSQLGYESPQSFSKAFRRVMGVSPTQYLEYERTKEDGDFHMPPDPLYNVNKVRG